MTLTVTITTDADGRITGLLVPEGACAHVAPDLGSASAFAAHFGADGEAFYRYEEDNDVGCLPHVSRGYRARQYLTLHTFDQQTS